MTQKVIHAGQIEIQLTNERRVEVARLEFDDDIAAQLEVVKEQVDIEVLIANFKVDLASYKRESGTKLQKKLLDVVDKGLLNFTFTPGIRCSQKIEQVGILENLGRHVGVNGRQCCREIA